MEERVFELSDRDQKIALVQQLLWRQLQLNRDKLDKVKRFIPLVRSFQQYGSVAHFLKENIIHERKLQRDFDRHVGLSPKLFQRILRFKNAVSSFYYRPAIKNLTSLALDCGYYDQAHFINEFRFFSGLSPRQYFQTCQNGISKIWSAE